MKHPQNIAVGILASSKIEFRLIGTFKIGSEECQTLAPGNYTVSAINDQMIIESHELTLNSSSPITLVPVSPNNTFILKKVTIGIDFHWEQKEDQRFSGKLKFIKEGNQVWAINLIHLEDYLQSVISSEMSANASLEFLKAHAVISRSWVLAQIQNKGKTLIKSEKKENTNPTEIERWYDHEDHQLFDVCADDHCQRYQGTTKIVSEKALQAVQQTEGEVLVFNHKVCDTRFSKCCGGISENFENVWEPVYHPYLSKVVDSEFADTTCVDLRIEEEAKEWIRNKPHAYCNTDDQNIIRQVLPGFDQKTSDFFRWTITYSQKELAELLQKKSGLVFGEIIELKAIKRGHSSRIIQLKITGTKLSVTVGKELEIRKWLSNSHLYSSAFVVEPKNLKNGIPQKFTLSGAGWGHGVGLCQIGAAVMGEKGFSYRKILQHYFKNAELIKLAQ